FLDPAHPYTADIDIFGAASLFQFLSTARTRVGEETLASWLLAAAPAPVIRQRQQAVAELAGKLDLREDLAVVSAAVALHPEKLRAWSAETGLGSARAPRVAAATLVLVNLGAMIAATSGGPVGLPLLTLLLQIGFAWYWRSRVHRICADAERALRDLGVLSLLLGRLERETFTGDALRSLRFKLDSEGLPPSRRIHQLSRRVELLDARRNELFAPFGALLMWTTQAALAIEAWRRHHGPAIREWLDVIGEIEALTAFAAYSFEHPEDAFPEIVEGEGHLAAVALGHPLIADGRNVRNDLRLDAEQRLLIVSGSNMSGKSTLLRAVGVNVVLALAGAPVRAKQLRLSPLGLGASIRVMDSLETGTSRFYAEIKRLRQLVELSGGARPLLFLLDEVLSGTNSHDRRAGAEAVARSLIARGSLGLLTTHDLALAKLADNPELHAINVHFEDTLDRGEMSFDYHLRPGVVQKSNALELMRAVGLEV
ncbi:MAG TPA: mismatch repair protein, partial [Terriglobales bacterium]|nr:mismatch repair protein [Terriglobales bacterium]